MEIREELETLLELQDQLAVLKDDVDRLIKSLMKKIDLQETLEGE